MNALPAAPPPDSWTDTHEPATEPTASSAPFTRGLDLTRTPGVLSLVRRAEMMTDAGQHESARVYATTALVSLARILGVDERGVQVIELLVPVDDAALAAERGAIVEELDHPLSHLRDMREP